MQFTYKIENYYPNENRLFVIYTPTDENQEPYGHWVTINPDMTVEQIKECVIYNFPSYKWLSKKSEVAETLIGLSDTAIKEEVLAEPIIIPTIRPEITPLQKLVEGSPELQSDGNLKQTWIIEDLVGDELLAAEAKIEELRKEMLWLSAHNTETSAISGSAIGLITMGVLAGKPKCLAVQAWIQTLWTEYYTRKAIGSTDYDFTAFANCPHSVPELMQELGL